VDPRGGGERQSGLILGWLIALAKLEDVAGELSDASQVHLTLFGTTLRVTPTSRIRFSDRIF
jgi:hypothetical protein